MHDDHWMRAAKALHGTAGHHRGAIPEAYARAHQLYMEAVEHDRRGRYRSTPLTFGELTVGAKFIAFPQDGDDSGHGGFRQQHAVFIKQLHAEDGNAFEAGRGVRSRMPASMLVLRVRL